MKRLFKYISRNEGADSRCHLFPVPRSPFPSVPCSPFPVPFSSPFPVPRSLLFPVPSHKGFTLIEMLVVIGIIVLLVGSGMAGYSAATKRAQRARGEELVQNLQTALVMALQQEDAWPPAILKAGSGGDGRATVEPMVWLGKHRMFAFGTILNPDERDPSKVRLEVNGVEELGLLSPWGEAEAKKRLRGGSLGESTRVPSGGTMADHRLRFAIDEDYDGFTEVKASVGGGASAKVRANACVWCCGYDGKFGTKDDIFSWTRGQEVK